MPALQLLWKMENFETYGPPLIWSLTQWMTLAILSRYHTVKMDQHEWISLTLFVYSDVPLQSFINGLTGITADKIAKAPKLSTTDFKCLLVTLHLSATMLLSRTYLFCRKMVGPGKQYALGVLMRLLIVGLPQFERYC